MRDVAAWFLVLASFATAAGDHRLRRACIARAAELLRACATPPAA